MTLSSMLCICLVSLVFLSMVRTEWVYPDLVATEGRMKQPRMFLNQIRSSNTNVVRYSFLGDGQEKFEVDVEGKVYQVAELDREVKEKYVLMASAFDLSGERVEEDQEISIIVNDINDNSPIFVDETLSGTVAEGAAPGAVFTTVSATDADDAVKTFNAEVVYEIDPGSDSPSSDSGNRFAVNKNGQVSVIGNLDYETDPVVYFVVLAIDGGGIGNGLNTATASFTVSLTDSNDNAPVFDGSTLPAVKYLSELSGLNTPLHDIYADDADTGKNKKVYFDITSGNIGGTFTIVCTPSDSGKSSGELQLVKPLDYESGKTVYTLTVRAYNKESDNSADIKYQETATLTINVTDANEAPVFINTPYTGIVSEDDDDPTDNEAVPINVKVKADDYDFGGNQTVEFSLNDPEHWFKINPQNGEISRVAKVDREAPAVINGIYVMTVVATDNYDRGEKASGNAEVSITIQDINDNPPSPGWGEEESVQICEQPINDTVKLIVASDPDSTANGPPFIFRLDSNTVDTGKWGIRYVNAVSSEIISKFDDYDLSDATETIHLPFTITDSGSPLQTGTATLTVTVCKCDDDGKPACSQIHVGAFPIAIVIAIIAVLLLIIILIFALAYKRHQASLVLKEPFFNDEDDVRETVQVYQEEGGEEDQDAYDLSALRAPLMEDPNQPVRIEKPLQQAPRAPRGHIPDDIGDHIGGAKYQADADPSAPPFDSLLVFDYEGLGSDAGSLSSINTATTDGSIDYDYLNNWGPRFQRLADMYNDGSESE